MSNPLINKKVTNNNSINGVSQIISAFKMMRDPSQLIRNNPQLQSLLAMYNGDAKTAFYKLCEQKGVNPEDILSQLK